MHNIVCETFRDEQQAVVLASFASSFCPLDIPPRFNMSSSSSSSANAEQYVLSQQLEGHSGEVRCATWIAGGEKLVTGGFDATCIVWSFPVDSQERATRVTTIHGNSDFVYAVSPHPFNPEWFISSSKDKQVIVFDSISGEKMMTLPTAEVHTGPVCSLAVGAGGLLAVGSWDGSFSVWNLETGEIVRHVKNAGSHAITVAMTQGGVLISGSQDGALKHWSMETGELLLEVPKAHDDIIRSIAVQGDVFATASNDQLVKLWSTSDPATAVTELAGSDNFVFSVDVSAAHQVLSSGEDMHVRIFSPLPTLAQSIPHPGTVWFAKFCPNAPTKFVSGCSDGVVRVFTQDPNQQASLAEIEAFTQLSLAAQPESSAASSVDPATVPMESQMHRWSGRKAGEIKMFKNDNDVVFAYQWTNEGSWEKVGLVTGSGSGGKRGRGAAKKAYAGDQYFPQGEYDYVFDVELGESGGMALLPVNANDNPLVVAEKFCARQQINKSNIGQIVDFVKANVASSTAPQAPLSSSPKELSSSHFPLQSPYLFREAKWEALISKIKSSSHLSPVDSAMLDHICALLQQPPSHLTPDMRAVEVALVYTKLPTTIPVESLFAVFDLWRLFVLHPSAAIMYKDSNGGSQYISLAARHLKANPTNNTGLCCARYLANLFNASVSKWAAMDSQHLYVDTVVGVLSSGASAATLVACASVLANVASATTDKRTTEKMIESASSLAEKLVPILASPAIGSIGSEACYRLLAALGSALLTATKTRAESSGKVADAVSCVKAKYQEENIQACCNDILRLIQ